MKIFTLVNQCILWMHKEKNSKKDLKNPEIEGHLAAKRAKIKLSKA